MSMLPKYLFPEFFQRLVWLPLRLSMLVFFSLEIKGIENVKNLKGNMIIASNHLSELDPLLIVSIFPFFSRNIPIIYVSRQKSFYTSDDWAKWKRIVYGGIFFEMIGAYPSYKGLKNYKIALHHHLEVTENRRNVAIFPYGGIVRSQKKPRAGGGVSFLAYETKLPILPLKISGTEDITLQNIFSRKKKITFTFGDPLYARDIFRNHKKIILNDKQNDYVLAAEMIMKKIESLT